jgi:hypothetical protein
MILPGLILKSRANLQCNESGIDSYERCSDQDHFKNFPHAVKYHYNSRGFRDLEWPTDPEELKSSIWCIGDSFTVGLGSPFSHTWPQVLQQNTGLRVINVSMDGASNDWIARQTINIHQAIAPKNIIVMWSYFHRRESATGNSDEEKKLHFVKADDKDDLINFKNCIARVNLLQETNLVYFLIPRAYPDHTPHLVRMWNDIKGPDWPSQPPLNLQELDSLPSFILHELKNMFGLYQELQNLFKSMVDYSSISTIHHVPQMDWARDKHHFDILTSQWVAEQAMAELKL